MIKERYIFLHDLNIEILVYLDPVFTCLLSLFEPESLEFPLGRSLGIILFFFILACVSVHISKLRSGRSVVETGLSAALLTGALYFISQGHFVVYLLIIPLLLLKIAAGISNAYARIFFYLWGLIISGPLSFLNACLVNVPEFKSKRIYSGVMTIPALLVGFIITLYFSSRAVIFDYPGNAQLMSLSPFTNMGSVCMGPDRIPFSMNREHFLKGNLQSLLLALLFGAPAIVFIALKFFRELKSRKDTEEGTRFNESNFALLLLSALLFISVLSYGYGYSYTYSMEALLIRCFPGIIWRPMPFLFSAIFIFVLFHQFLSRHSRKERYVFLAAECLILLCVMSFSISAKQEKSIVNYPDTSMVIRNFSLSEAKKNINHTPSSFLSSIYFENNIDHITSVRDRRDTLSNVPFGENIICQGKASRNNDQANFPLDGDHKTRWSTGGPQNSGDWYEVQCSGPLSVKQIHLSIAFFKSDFPRGLRVQADDNGNLRDIISLDEWFGSVQYTPSGLPYFGPQSDVVIDLPEEITSNRFRFTLTRGDSLFDWSIAKILFLN